MDTIKTDKNGVAKSSPLPLGRYQIVESKSYPIDPLASNTVRLVDQNPAERLVFHG